MHILFIYVKYNNNKNNYKKGVTNPDERDK